MDDKLGMKLGWTSNTLKENSEHIQRRKGLKKKTKMKFNRHKYNIGRSNHLHKCRMRKNWLGNSSSQKDVGETVYSS